MYKFKICIHDIGSIIDSQVLSIYFRFKMQFVTSTSSQLIKSPFLYVSCISEAVMSYQPVGCACISIHTREMHASFTSSIASRKVFLVTDHHELQKLSQLAAPIWILATSYCDVEVPTIVIDQRSWRYQIHLIYLKWLSLISAVATIRHTEAAASVLILRV